MLYEHAHEEECIKIMPLNDFCDDNNSLKVIEEQPTENDTTIPEVQDQCYIQWKIFDWIPKRVYTILCKGYFEKNSNPLNDEVSQLVVLQLLSADNKWITMLS